MYPGDHALTYAELEARTNRFVHFLRANALLRLQHDWWGPIIHEYYGMTEAVGITAGDSAEWLAHKGTVGRILDVGHVDVEGYLYLTDRATFMFVSGGVNIYPQECEDLPITHPRVSNAAVFGVPNADLGEEVKAAVQLMPGTTPGPDIAAELIAFCGQQLAGQKVSRSIDFEAHLPTGKLNKRIVRDR